jgi:L-lactate dehydrogenase complex protein LldF
MDITSNNFISSASIVIQNTPLRETIHNATLRKVGGRIALMGETTDADALRQQARAARLRALNNLPDMLEMLERKLTARGAHVLWAADADECNRLVIDIADRHNVRRIVKAKSMATEEIALNDALEAAGRQVFETDLGEFVVQIAHDRPSHIVGPILHMNRFQVRDLFVKHIGMTPTDDPAEMTQAVRVYLRQRFIEADMGITGANFAIAEEGTLAIITNEGNGRMSSSLPRVHVVVVGIEKVIESVEDFATLVQLLTRVTSGLRLSSYVHIMGGPANAKDPDGPEEMYVILLDNGRSRIYGGEYSESLACIRCGACLDTCPVYQQVGGHPYGWVYSGPIGAVITPLMVGLENAAPLPHASSLCGACQQACPVAIDIPRMLLALRSDLVHQGESDPAITLGMKAWSAAMQSPRLYEIGGNAARVATRAAANGNAESATISHLPGLLGNWTRNRDFPPFAAKSFRQLWRERDKRNQT